MEHSTSRRKHQEQSKQGEPTQQRLLLQTLSQIYVEQVLWRTKFKLLNNDHRNYVNSVLNSCNKNNLKPKHVNETPFSHANNLKA